jgi:hypothetical protein
VVKGGNYIRNGFLIPVSLKIGVWEEIDSMELEFFYLPKTIKINK